MAPSLFLSERACRN